MNTKQILSNLILCKILLSFVASFVAFFNRINFQMFLTAWILVFSDSVTIFFKFTGHFCSFFNFTLTLLSINHNELGSSLAFNNPMIHKNLCNHVAEKLRLISHAAGCIKNILNFLKIQFAITKNVKYPCYN